MWHVKTKTLTSHEHVVSSLLSRNVNRGTHVLYFIRSVPEHQFFLMPPFSFRESLGIPLCTYRYVDNLRKPIDLKAYMNHDIPFETLAIFFLANIHLN